MYASHYVFEARTLDTLYFYHLCGRYHEGLHVTDAFDLREPLTRLQLFDLSNLPQSYERP